MGGIRALLLRQRGLAIFLIALALCAKALVPAGFMVEAGSGSIRILVCADATGKQPSVQIAIPHASGKSDAAAKAHETCAFSVLGFASLGPVDPILLALALAFILAIGLVAVAPVRLAAARRLLPPACGPPLRLLIPAA